MDSQRRQNLEIDAIAQRRTDSAMLGAEVQLTGKTSLRVSVTRSSLGYAPNSLFLGTDLGSVLDNKTSEQTVGLRYAATPLTKFAVEVSHVRASFETETDRNSGDLTVVPSVEFSPFALVSGRAAVGFIKRTFENGTASFSGSTALVDLSYILLGRTRFTVRANRRLEYSYLPGLRDYIEAGTTIFVTQRLGDAWEIGGSFGRSHLSYRQTNPTVGQVLGSIPDESVLSTGVDLGYNVRHTRVGLYAEHIQRDSDLTAPGRGYQKYRFGSTVKYDF